MAELPEAYEILYPANTAVNGCYVRDPKTRRFFQKGGIYTLAQHTTGQWGVGDGHFYLFLAKQHSHFPTDRVTWQILVNNNYVPCPSFCVTLYKAPPAHVKQPLAPVPAPAVVQQAAVPAPQVHDFVEREHYEEKAEDWKKMRAPNGNIFYQNKAAGKVSQTVPNILLNVSLYMVETADQSRISFFAPISMVQEVGGKVVEPLYLDTWRDCETNWSRGLEALEGEMYKSHRMLESLKKADQSHEEERKTLTETLARMKANLESGTEKERLAQERSEAMTSRLGRGHIKRDEPPPSGPRDFPTGEELRDEYAAVFGDNFAEAAEQATVCMEDVLKMRDSKDFFVHDIIAPLFKVTKDYVTEVIAAKYKLLADNFGVALDEEEEGEGEQGESIARLFFLSSQQELLLSAVMGVDKAVIKQLIGKMGNTAVRLYEALPTWAARSATPLTFDLAEMVRLLLRVHTVIELSDPKCYLYPDAKTYIVYPDDKRVHREIFKPGVRAYGPLARGEEVQVVVPGLYFQPPTSCDAPPDADQMMSMNPKNGRAPEPAATLVVPVVCAKVRRLVNTPAIDNNR